MKRNKLIASILSLSITALLVACSSESNVQETTASSEVSSMESMAEESSMDTTQDMEGMNHSSMDHGSMDHSSMNHNSMDHGSMDDESSEESVEDLEKAENPTYNVGDTVIITVGHMEGMEGAKAEIVGAFERATYEVSYDPTNGGPRVENHRWVSHEEIAEAGEETLTPGTEVTLEATHMEGMEGAIAIIEDVEETTVYMIDYQPTTGGETVRNHKWVTDSEITAE